MRDVSLSTVGHFYPRPLGRRPSVTPPSSPAPVCGAWRGCGRVSGCGNKLHIVGSPLVRRSWSSLSCRFSRTGAAFFCCPWCPRSWRLLSVCASPSLVRSPAASTRRAPRGAPPYKGNRAAPIKKSPRRRSCCRCKQGAPSGCRAADQPRCGNIGGTKKRAYICGG